MEQGFLVEIVDPNDRRRRLLKQTRKGKSERNWQIREMDRLFDEILEIDRRFLSTGDQRSAAELLDHMEGLTRKAPKRKR
jgi:DNA-binding MarR family transcriptional regulator